MKSEIRKVKASDIPQLKSVLDSSELFPSHMLDDMINDYLHNIKSTDLWFTTVIGEKPISLAYCAPEKMTVGTYNLLAIAVSKDFQGQGIGKLMMEYIEHLLARKENRILIVETSGKPEFELTRKFYEKCHYTQQAIIPEFYNRGDDKIIFWKKLI